MSCEPIVRNLFGREQVGKYHHSRQHHLRYEPRYDRASCAVHMDFRDRYWSASGHGGDREQPQLHYRREHLLRLRDRGRGRLRDSCVLSQQSGELADQEQYRAWRTHLEYDHAAGRGVRGSGSEFGHLRQSSLHQAIDRLHDAAAALQPNDNREQSHLDSSAESAGRDDPDRPRQPEVAGVHGQSNERFTERLSEGIKGDYWRGTTEEDVSARQLYERRAGKSVVLLI